MTTVVYALALLTLSPPLAATLIIAHLIIGVILPKLFASAVRGIGPELRKESSALDDEMLDDMRGIGEIIRFGQGDARLASIQRRTRSLWVKRVRLSVKNGDFAGFGAVLVMLFTAIVGFPCDDVVHCGFHCRRYVGRPDVDGFRGIERPSVGCGFRAARQLVWADACVECVAGESDANVCFGTPPVRVDG